MRASTPHPALPLVLREEVRYAQRSGMLLEHLSLPSLASKDRIHILREQVRVTGPTSAEIHAVPYLVSPN